MSDFNKLKKIHDKSLIYSHLQSTKDNEHEVWVWRMIGDEKHLVSVRFDAIRKTRSDFSLMASDKSLTSLRDLVGGSSALDIYIPDSSLLFRANIKQFDPLSGKFYLEVPPFMAQVERRKNFRVNVYSKSDVMVEFSKNILYPRAHSQIFLKSCFDISAGGFSFLVSRLESKYFKEKDKISSLKIKIGERNIDVDASVISVLEIEPDIHNRLHYKVWKICCKLDRLDVFQKKFLEKYIFERIIYDLNVING